MRLKEYLELVKITLDASRNRFSYRKLEKYPKNLQNLQNILIDA